METAPEDGRPTGDEVVEELRARSGLQVLGAFAFGDTPALQDELLAAVRRGTKRATVSSREENERSGEPIPEPGQHWGLLDGRGHAAYVMETVHVTRGRLDSVTPAFAWDEGEDDRTRESWLDGHRRYYRRAGVEDPDALEVFFERFRIVWPEADRPPWVTEDVRELRWDERDWLRDVYARRWGATRMVTRGVLTEVPALPGLVCERKGDRVGLLTFRPRPGGEAEAVSVDAFERGAGVGRALTDGLVELGRRSGWHRLWLVTTNDNTTALRAYQRLGWDLVALHRGAVNESRRIKPEIPDTGDDGIPIHSEIELEIRLDAPAQGAS